MTSAMQQKRIEAPTISVDYPEQDEKIAGADYTVRVSAPESVKSVEVSIDQGAWQPCRQAIGYWWHDWTGFAEGEHEVVVRCETGNGRKTLSETKEFFVVRTPAEAVKG